MTVFAYDLINETERHLLSGDRDELNSLSTSLLTAATSASFTYDLGGIAQGSYVAIDLEVAYVWDSNDAGKSATLQRGMLGSVAADHVQGMIVYVNPTNSKWDIFCALNQEIADMSAPSNGLFAEGSFDLTSSASARTYTVPNVDVLDVLEVRWDRSGVENEWPRVDRRDYRLIRDLPTTEFAYGSALRIDKAIEPGRTIRVRYSKPFTQLTAIDDPVTTTTGLATTMLDIPALGAAMRLMGVREAKRGLAERTDSGRKDVATGAAARSAAVLQQLLQQRIRAEASMLAKRWPR